MSGVCGCCKDSPEELLIVGQLKRSPEMSNLGAVRMKIVLYLVSALFLAGAVLIGAIAEGLLPYYWGVLAEPKMDIMRTEVVAALLAAVLFGVAARRAG